MLESDINAMRQQITQQLTVTYRQTIASQLNLYECQKLATGPDRAALDWIQAKAKQDSEAIAKTYDRELKNKIARLRQENPRGNRFYYLKALDEWLVGRTAFKTSSISLNTMSAARQYAQDRFTRENNIGGKWVMVGPPPVCKNCMRIKGYGPQTFEQTQQPRRHLPAHVSCPHRWGQLVPKKIACNDETWTG
jgi:hypothetical protein